MYYMNAQGSRQRDTGENSLNIEMEGKESE